MRDVAFTPLAWAGLEIGRGEVVGLDPFPFHEVRKHD
jgi:hypothetical protein